MVNYSDRPIVCELVDNQIAMLASLASIELDNFRIWKEGRIASRTSGFEYTNKLASGLESVLEACPGDSSPFVYVNSGVSVLAGDQNTENDFKVLIEQARSVVQGMIDRLSVAGPDMDLYTVTELCGLCINIHKLSNLRERSTIRL